ncbi:hypothetical protein ACQPXH_20705 [Nocardia sp. CA-135953]|uniref:hypothetical protein n=1 Tax=Nocardia sp. CA-135953 TaxID=3239978 RepID=UPI003D995204
MDKQRPPAMTLPDILAMTTSGQPAPGKRITLPSGALWEGGPTPGTSLVTLPDQDPILVSDNGSDAPNSLVGRSGPFAALAHAFEEVLGHVPNFFADRVASQALNLLRDTSKSDDTETRIVKFSAKTTLLNPAKRGGQRRPEDSEDQSDSVFEQNPVRRARGGLVYKPGDTVADGGLVSGPGGSSSDLVHLAASRGEYVVNADAAARAFSLLDAINSGWVPSADFLAGMLPSLAGADASRTTAPSNPNQWRDLLGQGVIADTLGGLGNVAVDAASWAGAALGSALAPMFGPGGLFAARPGSAASASVRNDAGLTGTGSAVPMTASIQATPSATLGFLGTAQPNSPTGAAGQLGSLAAALGSGITGAATAAGSRLGEMLGAAIQPALGPSGELAPVIGEQLGRLIGSQFGAQLSTSLTVQAGVGGGQASSATGSGGGAEPGGAGADSTGDGTAPEPTDGNPGGGTIVETAGPAASNVGSGNIIGKTNADGSRWEYVSANPELGTSAGWALFMPESEYSVPKDAVPDGFKLGNFIPDNGAPQRMVRTPKGLNWLDVLTGKTANGDAQTLQDDIHQYNPNEGNFADLVDLASQKVGTDLGTLLTPILGSDAPKNLADLAAQLTAPLGQAYSDADPNHTWTDTIGRWISQATGIEWTPNGSSGTSSANQITNEQQAGVAAFESGIQGLQQHGLVGGLTGAISGAGSTLGNLAGNFLGTLAAPFLGPAAPLAPVIGQFLGSMIGGSIAEEFTRPIEWVGNTIKELVGTGFGLTDLAEGPGGHTVRGDIYNFNGMDPKSASIAVERVRRRRAVAQQRGGGFGR